MFETGPAIIFAASALAGIVAVGVIAAWCFRGWLDLKRTELTGRGSLDGGAPRTPPTAMNRIEVADLKERVRRLEAIASGVEL
ncbi:MAG: hypothetical protein V2J26_05980 [Pacificimonas sp.]|jgi:hypothetical protein|nr:hypothetical protein [Pacificimonas sp.]